MKHVERKGNIYGNGVSVVTLIGFNEKIRNLLSIRQISFDTQGIT